MKIGYIIRLYGVSNRYAYGRTFHNALVFATCVDARIDKRSVNNNNYTKPQEIFQVELTTNGKPKRVIRKVR